MNAAELLNFIRQNCQMGIDGIKLVFDDTENEEFRKELKRELKEYDGIYSEAEKLIEAIGAEKQDIRAAVKIATHLSARMKNFKGTTSKIAESMIEGSTMGVTKIIKHMNEYTGDDATLALAQKLQKTEENNIENLKKFL